MAEYDTFGSLFAPDQPKPTVDDYAAFKSYQDEALKKHQEYSAGLKATETAVQDKEQDINLVDRVVTMLSPTTPTGARKFLGSELGRHLGIDPKAEPARAAMGMLNALDPTSAEVVRRMLVQQSSSAPPGETKKFLKGIFDGTIPLHELVKQVGSAGRGMIADGLVTGATFGGRPSTPLPPSGAGSDSMTGAAGNDTTAEGTSDRAGLGAGGETPSKVDKTKTEAGATDIKAPGALARDEAIWLPRLATEARSGRTFTTGDAAANGYHLSDDPATRRKMLDEYKTQNERFITFMDTATRLDGLLADPNASVGFAGYAFRSLDSIRDQIRQVGGQDLRSFDWKAMDNSTIWTTATSAVGRMIASSGDKSITSAQIGSLTAQLAFDMARASAGSGVLSNQDITRSLTQLGAAQSVPQFRAVLADNISQQYRKFSTAMTTSFGAGMEENNISLWNVPKESLMSMAASTATPPSLDRQIRAELESRMKGPADKAASDDAGAPYKPPPSSEPAKREGGVPREAREAAIKKATIDAERRDEALKLDTHRMAAESHDQSRDAYARQQTWRDEDKARADRIREEDKAEKRRHEIMAAFQNIAKMVAGSVGSISMPSSGGDGGAQDSGAFVIPKKGDRSPPRVGNARSGKRS